MITVCGLVIPVMQPATHFDVHCQGGFFTQIVSLSLYQANIT